MRFATGLEDAAVGSVTVIVLRELGISHPKLQEVLHRDFADCSSLSPALSGQDAIVFCLGAYTGAVSDTELRRITVDYTIEFARVLRGSSPNAAFSFLSGNDADPTGRSRIAFARYKGEAEKRTPRGRVPERLPLPARISTPWSRGRNRISAIACCAPSTPRFDCSFQTK
jgi:uncharacterized protein YbjT (DUF2867 family)